jgi:hypothetical protein
VNRIERFEMEFNRNSRLSFVFGLALELGIDDPITWFNAVGDRVIDAWIGYKKHTLDKKQDNQQLPPDEAHRRFLDGSVNRHPTNGHHRSH